ncbi:MAG: MYXO-CTERM sorting domain-containing protein [Phycisphaerales bacterium]
MSLKIRGLVALAGIAAAATVSSAASYTVSDLTAENSIGANPGPVSSFFGNTFSLTGGDNAINSISIHFGTATATGLVGRSFTAVLYSDATGGTPWDAVNVWSGAGVIATNNALLTIAVPNVAVTTNFVVGFIFDTAAGPNLFPAGFDETAPTFAGRSFAGFQGTSIPVNGLAAIPAASRNSIEGFGLVGNFIINATGVPTPGAAALLGVAGLAGLRRRR